MKIFKMNEEWEIQLRDSLPQQNHTHQLLPPRWGKMWQETSSESDITDLQMTFSFTKHLCEDQ